jgi:hypothetical protein
VLRRTQDPLKRVIVFDYRIITFFDVSFQILRLTITFVTPYRVSYNPNKLLRLLVPRHPPCALNNLIFLFLSQT